MINIFRNALFGDGHITAPNKKGNVQLIFTSTQLSNIEFKSKLLNSNVKMKKQGKNAYGKKDLYITTKTVPAQSTNKIEHINKLSIEDFFLWLIDDGSFHKHKHFMNLNSHALTELENKELNSYLNNCLNIKARIYTEIKRDGRKFWYQYLPKSEVLNFKPAFQKFIITNNLYGYEYKIGLTSQTIALCE